MSLGQHVSALRAARNADEAGWHGTHILGYGDEGLTALLGLLSSIDWREASRALIALDHCHLTGAPQVLPVLIRALMTRIEPKLQAALLVIILTHAESGTLEAEEALQCFAHRGLTEQRMLDEVRSKRPYEAV